MKQENTFGRWSFIIGFLLAIIVGVFGLALETNPDHIIFSYILIIIGIIIGLLNIQSHEVHQFLSTGTMLIIVTYFGKEVVTFIPWIHGILLSLLTLFLPAIIIVAIKHLYVLAKQ
jgi:hypothetical protein